MSWKSVICGLPALEVTRVGVLGADQSKAESGDEIGSPTATIHNACVGAEVGVLVKLRIMVTILM